MIILVLNQGLKSSRCIAFSFDGQVLAQAAMPIQTMVSNERVEQSPAAWLQLAREVIRRVVRQLGERSKSVDYLTVTTSASCLVAVDDQGNAIGDSVLVSDTRATREARHLEDTVEYQQVFSATGMKSSPDLMLPKILWLRKNEPERFERTAHFLNAGDYIVSKLTGQYVTDPNNALKFHYSASSRSYPMALLNSLSLSPERLPRVVEMGSDVGPVLEDVAQDLGLPPTCRVVISTYDALAAVVGTGVFNLGEAVDVSGTVTSFRAVVDRHLFDSLKRIYVTPHIGNNRWMAGGSNNLGGGIIEWLRQLLYQHLDDPYTAMEQDAASQSACPGGLIFLPHLLGERCPVWNPICRGVFFGLNRAHSRPQMTRAVFEGVAFSVRHILSVLQEFDVPVNIVTVSGGLARMDALNQIKADVLGVPIRKLKNFETTSVGAALICLISKGIFSEKEGQERFCRVERDFEPELSRHQIYEEFFALYCDVYSSLQNAYVQRNVLLQKLSARGINELLFKENL